MKKLWERALANRDYWDKWRIANDGFIAKAKLEAQLAHKRERDQRRTAGPIRTKYREETRKRATEELKKGRVPYVIEAVITVIVGQCIACRALLEKRQGVSYLIHKGGKCPFGATAVSITQRSLQQLQPPAPCSETVFFRGRERPCYYTAGADGLCALHRGRAARAAAAVPAELGGATFRPHGQPQENPQRPTDRTPADE